MAPASRYSWLPTKTSRNCCPHLPSHALRRSPQNVTWPGQRTPAWYFPWPSPGKAFPSAANRSKAQPISGKREHHRDVLLFFHFPIYFYLCPCLFLALLMPHSSTTRCPPHLRPLSIALPQSSLSPLSDFYRVMLIMRMFSRGFGKRSAVLRTRARRLNRSALLRQAVKPFSADVASYRHSGQAACHGRGALAGGEEGTENVR